MRARHEQRIRARVRARRRERGRVIRSSWASTSGVPVAPGTGRQKRLNVPICPARSPEAIHPRLPFVRPRGPGCPSSPSTFYTNDITVSPKSPRSLPSPLETVTRKIINRLGLAALVLFLWPRRMNSFGSASATFRLVFVAFFPRIEQADPKLCN